MKNLQTENSKRVKSCSKAAFTFTEMLVIVVIVSVLAMLSISASARTNTYSERAICLNNMKQLATASVMYATEHNDQMAFANWGNAFPDPGWAYKTVSKGAESPFKVREGLFWPYLPQENIFLCPSEKTNSVTFRARRMNRYQDVTSYFMNGSVCGFNSTLSFKLSAFSPNAVLFWQANEQLPFYFEDAAAYPDDGTTRLHGQHTVIGLFNGSAELILIKDMLRETGPEGARNNPGIGIKPGRFWCNPASPTGTF